MNLQELEAFVEVERRGSFSKAADRLFIPQPTLSNRIKVLEEELGVKLFERNNQKTILTDYGKSFLPFAVSIISQWGQLKYSFKEFSNNSSKTIRIGIPFGFFSCVMPELMPVLLEKFNDLMFSVTNSRTMHTINKLKNYTIDLGVTAYDIVDYEIIFQKIYEQEVMAIMSPEHPLAQKGFTELSLEHISSVPIVTFRKENIYRAQIDNLLKQKNINYKVIEIDEINTIIGVLKKNLGISFLPNQYVEKELKTGKLISLPIGPEKFKPYGTYLAYRAGDKEKFPYIQKVIDEFIKFCKT